MYFKDIDEARRIIGMIDPSLGRPLQEKSYAVDCALTIENLRVNLYLKFARVLFIFHRAKWTSL